MTAASLELVADDALELPHPLGQEVGWWAMALVCATEGCFFAFLLGSYFYLAARNTHWPPAQIGPPKLLLPGIMTATLLGSSAVLHFAERAIARGRQGGLRAGLLVTAVLGLAFLGLQWAEYQEKLQHFTPRTNAYGSSFYATTGFHGAHVAFGVLFLLFTLARAAQGHFTAKSHIGIRVAALYWHFVDGVWLVLFTTLYLLPHLHA
jgi:heme/copper-type cytochrome/quinol oxidase subunit 3